jgi:hypothetical protein
LLLNEVLVPAKQQKYKYIEMNPQENRDHDRRLQELEQELDKDRLLQSVNIRLRQTLQHLVNHSQPEKSVLNQVANWFNSLSTSRKVAVVAIAMIVSFSVLRSVLQLVGALISLALVGGILYLVYKFFVTPQSPN